MIRFLFFLILMVSQLQAQEIKASATEDWTNKPAVVTPGKAGSAPSDAKILFAEPKDLKNWLSEEGKAPGWEISAGALRIVKKAKGIRTRESFGSMQLHIEWATPDTAEDKSTSRGNSGVLFMGLYELQIYESYQYNTRLYYNGIAGSVYKQFAPLVNACLPPTQWQVFDAIFEAPEFNSDSTLKRPAYLTVIQNGVLIQNHVALKGPMIYQGYPKYTFHESRLPLLLQEHDSRVKFKNIWVRELDERALSKNETYD